MRLSPQQKLASSVCRSFSQLSGARHANRHFHRSAPAQLPRRRNFFTSNVLLQQDGSSNNGSGNTQASAELQNGASSIDRPSTAAAAAAAAAAKRKPRSGTAKNSLRRVAVIAQQSGGRPAPDAQTASSSASYPTPSSSPYSSQLAGPQDEEGPDGSNTISAVCLAESFDMERVMEILQSHGFLLDPEHTGFESHEVVHARGVSQGDIFVFESGTVVGWALPPEVVQGLASRQLLPAAQDPFVGRMETEQLEFQLDPSRETSAVRGDVVVLGTRREAAAGDRLDTTLAKIAFSSGLARSTKLAALESSFMDYFESTRRIPAMLAKGSHELSLSRRFILRKTGELLSLRAQLNHYHELTDSLPDIFWDSRSELGLEGYYDQVGKALDVGVRIRTLNQKMDYAQEIATVLREISSERHGTRLEWIIIVLIAVEVVFELRRVYLERRLEQGLEKELQAHGQSL